eukprot:1868543-Rhodomonas_salina.2
MSLWKELQGCVPRKAVEKGIERGRESSIRIPTDRAGMILKKTRVSTTFQGKDDVLALGPQVRNLLPLWQQQGHTHAQSRNKTPLCLTCLLYTSDAADDM